MSLQKKKLPLTYVGISISPTLIEAAIVQPSKDVGSAPHKIIRTAVVPVPGGVLSNAGDEVRDIASLSAALNTVLNDLRPKTRVVHMSIPATLLRVTEMPAVQPKELYLSLTSEAERYKTFDDTEAVVDFAILDSPPPSPGQYRVVFAAVRGDTLAAYKQACQKARIKVASIDIEPMSVLRGMAGSAVLDSLVQQIGASAYWGTIIVEAERVRLALWQGNTLMELREVQMDTREFALADPNTVSANDLFDEIQRTVKTNAPSIWLTYKMPPDMDNVLAQRFNVPVRGALIGPAVVSDTPSLQVATVGAALRSQVQYPFDFDLNTSAKLYAVAKQAAPDSAQTEAMVGLATVAGGILTFLALLAWGGISLITQFYYVAQNTEKQAQLQGVRDEMTSVQSQIDQISGLADYHAFAKEVLDKTKVRNKAFVEFIHDLRQKTPTAVWVYSIKVEDDDNLTFRGKSTDHEAIIDLAQSFDDVKYASSIVVNSIKEDKIGPTNVFRFIITGKVKADPSLVEPTIPKSPLDPLQAPAAGGAPVVVPPSAPTGAP